MAFDAHLEIFHRQEVFTTRTSVLDRGSVTAYRSLYQNIRTYDQTISELRGKKADTHATRNLFSQPAGAQVYALGPAFCVEYGLRFQIKEGPDLD
jgi:hypothetical protein